MSRANFMLFSTLACLALPCLTACRDILGLREGLPQESASKGGEDPLPSDSDASDELDMAGFEGGQAGDANLTQASSIAELAGAGGQSSESLTPSIELTERETTLVYGASSGTAYLDSCPEGQVAVAVHGEQHPDPAKAWIRHINLICAHVTISSTLPHSIVLIPGNSLPLRGGLSGAPIDSECPEGNVIVGFRGRSGWYLDQLVIECARLELVEGPIEYELALVDYHELPPFGGPGGYVIPKVDCGPNRVATGTQVRAGDCVTAFGLECARPEVFVP